MLRENDRQAAEAVPHQPTAPHRPPYPTHPFAGMNPERARVGLPGHCERCAEVGHVLAHPDYGCGDVGCSTTHEDESAGSIHPLLPGTRVHHISQQWARGLPGGTATVIDSRGPWPDGSYEYQVLATEDFSRQPGPGNPETRDTWWASHATAPAAGPPRPEHASRTALCFPCPLNCGWHADFPPGPATPSAARTTEAELRTHIETAHTTHDYLAEILRLRNEATVLRQIIESQYHASRGAAAVTASEG